MLTTNEDEKEKLINLDKLMAYFPNVLSARCNIVTGCNKINFTENGWN